MSGIKLSNLKKEYRDKFNEVIVYFDNLGSGKKYGFIRGDSRKEGLVPFFTKLQTEEVGKQIEIMALVYGINERGIAVINRILVNHILSENIDFKLSDLESALYI